MLNNTHSSTSHQSHPLILCVTISSCASSPLPHANETPAYRWEHIRRRFASSSWDRISFPVIGPAIGPAAAAALVACLASGHPILDSRRSLSPPERPGPAAGLKLSRLQALKRPHEATLGTGPSFSIFTAKFAGQN